MRSDFPIMSQKQETVQQLFSSLTIKMEDQTSLFLSAQTQETQWIKQSTMEPQHHLLSFHQCIIKVLIQTWSKALFKTWTVDNIKKTI